MKISGVVSGTVTDRLIAFLDRQPDDEVFTKDQLCESLGCPIGSGSFCEQRFRWKDYEHKLVVDGRLKSLWGSKAAIAALKQREKESHDQD
jgi:hypothetical protein